MSWRPLIEESRESDLVAEIDRKDRAIDFAIRALDQLSKKGSITKQLREETMHKLWEARQTQLDEV